MYLVELTLINIEFDTNSELTLPVMLTGSSDKAIELANKKMEEQQAKPDSLDSSGFIMPEEIHVNVYQITPELDVHANPHLKQNIFELKWDVTRKVMIED